MALDQLRDRRRTIIRSMRDIHDGASDPETGKLPKEQAAAFERLRAELTSLQDALNRDEEITGLEQSLPQWTRSSETPPPPRDGAAPLNDGGKK